MHFTTPLLLLSTLIATSLALAVPEAQAEAKQATPKYKSCGGRTINGQSQCKKDEICVDDPRAGGCGLACDAAGICVKPVFCGGFAGFACEKGLICVDDPRDDCDPTNGGADCGGICV
ncbi:hypothetical protein EJ08DRAFT_152699 [Tothia fuscella]|uniref:Uncharacterized protein n=1 Tax=Tothia fuscella TaxID=1048955 RepID=A0A9P4U4E4_9PEZI|nr:hypothetical protein EJ08DRAFT_152699 [Tothia fuscella]